MKLGPSGLALCTIALVDVLAQTGCGDSGGNVPNGVPDASQVAPDARRSDAPPVVFDAQPDALPVIPDGPPADAATPDAPPPVDDGCIPIELGRRDMHLGPFSQTLGVEYPLKMNLDGQLPEVLQVELFDSTTITTDGIPLPPLAPGAHRLGEGVDADLATCQYCVWIPVDWDHQGTLEKIFMATNGTLTLTEVTDPLDFIFVGALSDTVLREATIDALGKTTFVEGGRCLHVAPQSFDTHPTPGHSCLSVEDCGNSLAEICSPATNTCGDFECNDLFQACPAERPICLSQNGLGLGAAIGACYADCNPKTATGCAFGQTCIQNGPVPTQGICLTTGSAELGSVCQNEDNSTSCAPGLLCSDEGSCTRSCDFFAAAPGCQEGTQCTVFGVCERPALHVGGRLGEVCPAGTALGDGCAPDGTAFRGVCFSEDGSEPMVCQRACLGEEGCAAGNVCAPRFTTGLGICQPAAVCGDGQVSGPDEVCDDGNTRSGDGCSADCRTIEYDVICAAATPLGAGTSVDGDTKVGHEGFQAACQFGASRADVYAFHPPGRGQLHITVDSPTQQIVSLRTGCDQPQGEVGCSSSNDIIFNVPDDDSPDLTVLVSAATFLEEGPYTLHVEWIDEVCGDGLIAGREVCDDGNTKSGDGCRGDCAEIEYAAFCAAATPLVEGTPQSGETGGDLNLFFGTCAGPRSGFDHLFQYSAPADGTLHLEVIDDPSCFGVTLSATAGCDGPGVFPELACLNTFIAHELDVPVSRDQTITLLVEGFGPENVCPFTLSAQLVTP